jgi:hypothetical protein
MKVVRILLMLAGIFSSSGVFAGGPGSRYLQMSTDQRVSPGTVNLLSTTVQLPAATWVYVQSDGRYYPGGTSAANAYITINGNVVSNDSYLDWTQSNAGAQHSFNAVGAQYLPAGTHTVTLHGVAVRAPVFFGAGTNLSILATSATAVTNSRVSADTAQLNFNTAGSAEGSPLQADDRVNLLSASAGNQQGPIVAMASGRAYVSGAYGDAMMGILLNGQEAGISSMTWSINDLYTGAETQAPLYSQAMFTAAPSQSTVQFVASESPYYQPQDPQTNNVRYRAGANSRLVTLANGFQVYGKGLNPQFDYAAAGPYRRFAYVCVGTNGFLPGCPAAGSEVVIGRGQVCVPAGHNGAVLFSAKSRVQGDVNDGGGTVYLYLKLNGTGVGSLGVQQLGPRPNAVSTRTLAASYLAAEGAALAPGCHTIEAVAQVVGDFRHMMMNADMPVVWFD